jgi:hypothetical protein
MSTVRVITLAVKWTEVQKGMPRNAYATRQTGDTDFHKSKWPVQKLALGLEWGMLDKCGIEAPAHSFSVEAQGRLRSETADDH